MRLISIALLASGLAGAHPATAAEGAAPVSAQSDAGIRAVIEAFRGGIIAKDKAALNRLPVIPGITLLASVDPETLARTRLRRPGAKRLVPGTYPEFVDQITAAGPQSEETFSDISIRADGAIATVYFSYTFQEDGVVTNWGHESWGLVVTDDGWKISSIVYSITLPSSVKR
ncbi:hypothetical protein BH09PSE2_BH09PSE2_19600 [soil metagenome]